MLWGVLFIGMFLGAALGVIYLVSRFRRFFIPKGFTERHKRLSWVLAVLPLTVPALFMIINATAMVVVLLHTVIFWLVFDLIFFIIKKASQKQLKPLLRGVIQTAFVAVYLGAGWYFAHHVYETDYSISTEKALGQETLRIVEIADLHLGITLDGDEFAKELEKVQEVHPDIVFIVGDFVDDDSNKADMIKACKALGELDTAYGVYFVFGNHDVGYFNKRDFTADELRDELVKNNVVILEDESVLINDSFYVIGRKDRSMERVEAGQLTDGLDKSKYMIMLDHQPNDYTNEAAAQTDLVLSGHTHGGHVFPAGYVGLAIGANDRVYGTERRDSTNFIVTSGISGWAIPFKTGTISEFVVIDVSSES